MKKLTSHIYIILVLIAFVSCKQVTVKIDSVPANTPNGSQIYIAGNFNNWNPADPNFIMEQKDSIYFLTLPYGFGTLEYKFTRGSWETVETDECGHSLDNRFLSYRQNDTIVNIIESWEDREPLNCPRLTIIIDSVPENTPDTALITIAGNFNEWNPLAQEYELQRNSKGGYQITLMKPKQVDEIEFKFTRGDLSKIEADKFGNELPKRLVKFGITDTIVTNIQTWEDLTEDELKFVTIVLDKVPEKTNEDDEIFLVGNFNGWYPKDRTYKFKKGNDGKYLINLPRREGRLEFKVSRGSWETQELDKKGKIISNRRYWYDINDTINISVENWADRLPAQKVIFKVFEYPGYTPEEDAIYVAGNFNGWDPKDENYRMEKDKNGDFIKEVEVQNKRIEYKFTRGGWETEEANEDGYKIPNRIHKYIGIDTIFVSIKNWFDIPGLSNKITFIIDNYPSYTPDDANIYFVSNINGWDPTDRNFLMEKKSDKYYITFEVKQREIQYKFTRGAWRTVEGNRFGGEIGNRRLFYNYQDTIIVDIQSWKDLYRKR